MFLHPYAFIAGVLLTLTIWYPPVGWSSIGTYVKYSSTYFIAPSYLWKLLRQHLTNAKSWSRFPNSSIGAPTRTIYRKPYKELALLFLIKLVPIVGISNLDSILAISISLPIRNIYFPGFRRSNSWVISSGSIDGGVKDSSWGWASFFPI